MLSLYTGLICLSADLLSKYFANKFITGEVFILGEYVSLKLQKNSGIAFSMPLSGIILKILTIGLIASLIFQYISNERQKKNKLIDFGYGILLGGAIGNGVERVFFGEVIDFISVKYFAILNFGDIFINIGVAMLLFAYLRKKGMN